MRKLGQALVEDLACGMERGELVLQYQPRFLLSTHRLLGFEALVRWNHPKSGMLKPEAFFPLAKSANLMVPLARFVLRDACLQMACWHKTLPTGTALGISINTCFKYLQQESFIRDVEDVLDQTGLSPHSLQFEMRENSIPSHGPGVFRTIRDLKTLRVGLEVDNFGTGSVSMKYLHELPFDTLKIDPFLVRQLGALRDSSAIIHATLTLARRLGIAVVAAGVETQAQFRCLTALGCPGGQGRYFFEPLNACDAQMLIQQEIERCCIHVVRKLSDALTDHRLTEGQM